MTNPSWTRGFAPALIPFAMLTQVACTETSSGDEDLAEANQAVLSENALSENALSENALSENALSENALSENALSENALSENALVKQALKDPNARELFKYIVSCALPAEAHIKVKVKGVNYSFDGGLGLAPEWGEDGGSCDEECQSWVSACVIARLDYLGQPVMISLRGEHDALHTTAQERAKYKKIEATYYGNIFKENQEVQACLPAGKTQIPRVCGPSLNGCIVKVQGSCEDLCDDQEWDGGYPECRSASSWKNGHLKKGKKHVGSVTVFLQ